MTYYLSGPMTGYVEYNFPAFAEAAEFIRSLGKRVLSPHELSAMNGGGAGRTWQEYMREDIALLILADAIVLLPGWYQSKGARLELRIARSLGMPVFRYDTEHRLRPE